MTMKANSSSSGVSNPKTQNEKLNSDEVEPFIEDPPGLFSKHRRMLYCVLIWAVFFFVLGAVFLVFGLYKYHNTACEAKNVLKGSTEKNSDQQKLFQILNKTFVMYYQLYPSQAQTNVALTMRQRFDAFQPYDANWKTLKVRTDHSLRLRKKLDDLNIDFSNLRPREKKAYAQLEHYLEHTFGSPFHEDYYAGDWMTLPNYGCWQHFCSLTKPLQIIFSRTGFVPRSFDDVTAMIEKLKMFRKSVSDYRDNIALGVRSGFVRSLETCDSGYTIFKGNYPKIAEDGPKGVLSERFAKMLINPSYYSKISDDESQKLQTNFNKEIHQEISEVLVQYLGSPLHDFINFLKNNHTRHCVPADVASGLANLPLLRVWLDQKETDIETTRTLPTGERLNGSKTYEMILPYFTTTDQYNATSINALGENEKSGIYDQIKQIAMKITKKPETEAVTALKIDLEHPRHFFNTTPIPDSENGAVGGSRCKSMKSAKENCPVRYAAIQAWFDYAHMFMAKLDPMLQKMFYQTGEKATTPSCPIGLKASFNPSMVSHFYIQSNQKCSAPAFYYIPFFLKKPGPKYGIYSIVGHETRPGHHTQIQGFNEHFSTSGNNDVIDWLNTVNYYTAFTEGWALYAESPLLAKETDLYKDEPYQEYGMLKWQIWRALRLVIDTGLHSRGMTMKEALELFSLFAWDDTDKAAKDVIRYMGLPGQATAYTIGRAAILKMRNDTEEALGEKFDEKEFHYIILSQGSSPLKYLQDYIKDYVRCKLDLNSLPDCVSILNPKKANESSDKSDSLATPEQWEQFREAILQSRFDQRYN